MSPTEAYRLLGGMLSSQKEAGQLQDGGDAAKARAKNKPEVDSPPTLAEAGIAERGGADE